MSWPVGLENAFYKGAGVLFLGLSKIKNTLKGYSTPRTFSIYDYDRAIDYDIRVVDRWLSYLADYAGVSRIEGKVVLELGPGADLGVGLYLLSKGVLKYHAIDVHDLVRSVPMEFYERFFSHLARRQQDVNVDELKRQLEMTLEGRNDRLNYICQKDFDLLEALKDQKVDLVFSQAAFEHFDNVEKTIEQLSRVTQPGGIMIAEIDLKTHSRWIRDKDPNNIYRYSDSFYNLFKCRGSPNRLRPYQYEKFLKKEGWDEVVVIPLRTLDEDRFERMKHSLNRRFRSTENQMHMLSIMLCAKKRG